VRRALSATGCPLALSMSVLLASGALSPVSTSHIGKIRALPRRFVSRTDGLQHKLPSGMGCAVPRQYY